MKGQVSVETIMIIALVLMIFIPVLLLLYINSGSAFTSINTMEVNAALSQLSSSSSIVNSGAAPSAIFAKVYIPPSISNVNTSQLCNRTSCITEFIASMNDGTQMVQIASGKARINTTDGSLTQGTYYVKIEAVVENNNKTAVVSIYG
ncbi:MAG: hypothetical protein NTY68_03715 [Candidatus Micrarchaeota archaeon]|nr:hypothetical protein [Candidatus Micrarchaeota archaeon]